MFPYVSYMCWSISVIHKGCEGPYFGYIFGSKHVPKSIGICPGTLISLFGIIETPNPPKTKNALKHRIQTLAQNNCRILGPIRSRFEREGVERISQTLDRRWISRRLTCLTLIFFLHHPPFCPSSFRHSFTIFFDILNPHWNQQILENHRKIIGLSIGKGSAIFWSFLWNICLNNRLIRSGELFCFDLV